MVEQRTQARFRIAQRVFRQLVLGDVLEKADDSTQFAPGFAHREAADAQPAQATVAARYRQDDRETAALALQLADRLDQRAPVIGFEDVEHQRGRGVVEPRLATGDLPERRPDVLEPRPVGVGRPEDDIDRFRQLAKQFLALEDGLGQADTIVEFATTAHQVESEQRGEQDAAEQNQPMRPGKRLGTAKGMGRDAGDAPLAIAEGDGRRHPRLIRITLRWLAGGRRGGARIEPAGVKVEKLGVADTRLVAHQNLDAARLEQADGDVDHLLDVVDADHEAEGVWPLAGYACSNGTLRFAFRVERQYRIDDMDCLLARLREFHSSTDRDTPALSRPLEERRKFVAGVQVEHLAPLRSRRATRKGAQALAVRRCPSLRQVRCRRELFVAPPGAVKSAAAPTTGCRCTVGARATNRRRPETRSRSTARAE